jgi:RimJ/RimL family protein N-acetyltransferase
MPPRLQLPLTRGPTTLREDASGYLAALERATDDVEFRRYGYLPLHASADDVSRFLDRTQRSLDAKRTVGFVITAGNPGAVIGLADMSTESTNWTWVEAGYWIATSQRRRGHARRALAALTEWAFEDTTIRRVTLPIHPRNTASQKVAEACGYRSHGVAVGPNLIGGGHEAELFVRTADDREPKPRR